MKYLLITIGLSVLLLSGCSGRNYNAKTYEKIRLGETSRSELVALFGEPERAVKAVHNAKEIEMVDYHYIQTLFGSIDKRMTVRLYEDKVVGFEITNNDEFNTDYVTSRINQLTKGKTTSEEAKREMGPYFGQWITPITAKDKGTTLIYWYAVMNQGEKFTVLTFDEQGILINVEGHAYGFR